MKVCPYCQSTSFDDMESCFGCLHRFDAPAPATIIPAFAEDDVMDLYKPEPEPDLEPKLEGTVPLPRVPVVALNESATIIPTVSPLPESAQAGFSGIARLHVQMPQGYHYDIYLEKPEGASIQIGWIPDAQPISDQSSLPEQPDALTV